MNLNPCTHESKIHMRSASRFVVQHTVLCLTLFCHRINAVYEAPTPPKTPCGTIPA